MTRSRGRRNAGENWEGGSYFPRGGGGCLLRCCRNGGKLDVDGAGGGPERAYKAAGEKGKKKSTMVEISWANPYAKTKKGGVKLGQRKGGGGRGGRGSSAIGVVKRGELSEVTAAIKSLLRPGNHPSRKKGGGGGTGREGAHGYVTNHGREFKMVRV